MHNYSIEECDNILNKLEKSASLVGPVILAELELEKEAYLERFLTGKQSLAEAAFKRLGRKMPRPAESFAAAGKEPWKQAPWIKAPGASPQQNLAYSKARKHERHMDLKRRVGEKITVKPRQPSAEAPAGQPAPAGQSAAAGQPTLAPAAPGAMTTPPADPFTLGRMGQMKPGDMARDAQGFYTALKERGWEGGFDEAARIFQQGSAQNLTVNDLLLGASAAGGVGQNVYGMAAGKIAERKAAAEAAEAASKSWFPSWAQTGEGIGPGHLLMAGGAGATIPLVAGSAFDSGPVVNRYG